MQTYECCEILRLIQTANWPKYRKSQFANISATTQCLRILKSHHFAWKIRPYKPQICNKHTFKCELKIANPVYMAVLGLGSNIEPEIWRFKKLAARIARDKRVSILASSPFVINKAFGYLEQKDFTNAVLIIKTCLTPRQLLKWALHEEKVFGRIRSFKNAPRTLDVDLLYCSGLTYQSKSLKLPHPGSFGRSSVFIPLGLI